MPSEKSSIVSFQPSRGCICSHISRVVVSQNDEMLLIARMNDALSAYKAVGHP
jgi:hypothetical protein